MDKIVRIYLLECGQKSRFCTPLLVQYLLIITSLQRLFFNDVDIQLILVFYKLRSPDTIEIKIIIWLTINFIFQKQF